MYSTNEKAHREKVQVGKSCKVVLKIKYGDRSGSLVQTTTTTTESWVGLSKDNAETLTITTEDLRSVGIRFDDSTGHPVKWAAQDNLEGTTVQSVMQRMGDTNLYQVTRTTTVLETTAKGGVIKYYLDEV